MTQGFPAECCQLISIACRLHFVHPGCHLFHSLVLHILKENIRPIYHLPLKVTGVNMDTIYTSYSNSTVWFGSADQISVSFGHLRLSCHLTSCPSYVLVGITNCILFWRCSDSVIYPSRATSCDLQVSVSSLIDYFHDGTIRSLNKYGFLGRVARKKLFLFKNNMATQLGLQNCNNSKT